jgi:hypothetical protein
MLCGADKVEAMPEGPNYENDFYAWTQHQAAVLREMPTTDNRFDREHVAEEIGDLGKSERNAVCSQLRRIIEHFLKLSHSPAQQPRFGWMASIADGQAVLGDKLSPTLRRDAEAALPKLYRDGRRQAELGLRDQASTKRQTSCRRDHRTGWRRSLATSGTLVRPEKSHDEP